MKSSNRFKSLKFWLKHAIWFVPAAYVLNFIYAITSDQSGGTFGDTFGAANALFSGTALLMLVLAVTLQREELEQVKEERNDTRKLLEGQEALNELQKAALEKQTFHQAFGSKLSLVLEERSRLSDNIFPSSTAGESLKVRAGLAGEHLLESVAHGQDILSDSFHSARKRCNELLLFANLLLDLASLIERVTLTVDEKLSHMEIIYGLLKDPHLSASISLLHAVEKLERGEGASVSPLDRFALTYGLSGFLEENAAQGYQVAMSAHS